MYARHQEVKLRSYNDVNNILSKVMLNVSLSAFKMVHIFQVMYTEVLS